MLREKLSIGNKWQARFAIHKGRLAKNREWTGRPARHGGKIAGQHLYLHAPRAESLAPSGHTRSVPLRMLALASLARAKT